MTLGFILGTTLGVGILGLIVLNLIDGIWRLASTIWVRKSLALVVTGILLGATLLAAQLAALSLDFVTSILAAVATIPWPAAYISSRIAFIIDSKDTKQLALVIREELDERYAEKPASPSSFWLDYIFDAEFGRRRERYQPPPL